MRSRVVRLEPGGAFGFEGTEGRCPFCGGRFTAGYLGDGQGAVLHTLPLCSAYERLEIDEYLHAVNEFFRATPGGHRAAMGGTS